MVIHTKCFRYMASEVFMGQKANERLDIYSWARHLTLEKRV